MGNVATLGDSLLEGFDARSLREPIAVKHLVDRRDVELVDRLASVGDRHGTEASEPRSRIGSSKRHRPCRARPLAGRIITAG